ncbi:MAG: hypothetical protein QGH25_16285 [Candidatus Latescibacteria bacterium]|nr:hypothetical protein [Candidatus Latescibacterota bacterium]
MDIAADRQIAPGCNRRILDKLGFDIALRCHHRTLADNALRGGYIAPRPHRRTQFNRAADTDRAGRHHRKPRQYRAFDIEVCSHLDIAGFVVDIPADLEHRLHFDSLPPDMRVALDLGVKGPGHTALAFHPHVFAALEGLLLPVFGGELFAHQIGAGHAPGCRYNFAQELVLLYC